VLVLVNETGGGGGGGGGGCGRHQSVLLRREDDDTESPLMIYLSFSFVLYTIYTTATTNGKIPQKNPNQRIEKVD